LLTGADIVVQKAVKCKTVEKEVKTTLKEDDEDCKGEATADKRQFGLARRTTADRLVVRGRNLHRNYKR